MYQESQHSLSPSDLIVIKEAQKQNGRLLKAIAIFSSVILVPLAFACYKEHFAIATVLVLVVLGIAAAFYFNHQKYQNILDLNCKIRIQSRVLDKECRNVSHNSESAPEYYLVLEDDITFKLDLKYYDKIAVGDYIDMSFVEINRPQPYDLNKYRGTNVVLSLN